jgi:hypothetical protein
VLCCGKIKYGSLNIARNLVTIGTTLGTFKILSRVRPTGMLFNNLLFAIAFKLALKLVNAFLNNTKFG